MKFQYKVTDEKLQQAKKLILQHGGTIYTDNTFKVKGCEGCFEIRGDVLTVEITSKPWLANWGMIKDGLDKFFK